MSRNFIPVALAIGAGVCTGYYAFQPALQELQAEREGKVNAVPSVSGSSQQQQQQQLPTPQSAGGASEVGKSAGQ
ncbi:uncharacterized protein BO97DRAFT_402293 [Aspergillus homomorphus CBS 101889]|uniref:Uncharacterized protein n=1 Tax=Aspergillus homomorphus (strain CBS 101889) TaxID=1450537 RepID=A0A395ICN7_ASPHC|nr:hypothetical protein BO97DRAFT_402293 [Aspergillus homomorphus CBS 101889]RAL17801.1 hypothetical protein BO97DRAFT_402293 [Aspergillus homomorphus CBS 101889]